MSVSTEYFDYVFNQRNVVTDDFNIALGKLDQYEERKNKLQTLVDERASKKRLKRLDKWTDKVEQQENKLDKLAARLNVLNGVELPKDEVTFGIWNPTDDITGIQVTITDSPYDDSFVGGQDSSVYVRGTGYRTESGTRAYGSRVGLIGSDFEDDTRTFAIGGSLWEGRLNGNYPEVQASILQGWTPRDGGFDFTPTFVTPVYAGGELQLA